MKTLDDALDNLYQRLLARTVKDPETGCWNWTGPRWDKRPFPSNRYGYISYSVNGKGKTIGTHRAMWIALHGPTESSTKVCHRCDNPICINPRHLFAGLAGHNTKDMLAKNRHNNGRKIVCKRGHELAGDNLWVDVRGVRHCKTCQRARHRINTGWPEELAYAAPAIPMGHRMNRETGEHEMNMPKRLALNQNGDL